MKDIRKNIKGSFFILMGLYALLVIYLCYALFFYGDRWFANAYNSRVRLSHVNPKTIPGDIMDRNGTVLATTKKTFRFNPENEQKEPYYFRAYHKDAQYAAHVVGYHHAEYGRMGAEAFYVQYLMGYNNSFIERVYQKAFLDQEEGNDIELTIDLNLQKFIGERMGDQKGSVVLMNPQTGEILAMVSKPGFNPNDMKTIQDDDLVNRAVQGYYPPGSIFKLITAAAAMEQGIPLDRYVFDCQGFTFVGDNRVNCYRQQPHGAVDITRAMIFSCNGFFSHLAVDLGWEKLKKTGEAFGFNDNFLFTDIKVYPSMLPLSSKTAEEELAWDGVGQGKVLVTPLHMAMVAASIGNDGVMMEPKLLYRVIGRRGQIQKKMQPQIYRLPLQPENADRLKKMMSQVVAQGTGKSAGLMGVEVAGKTGTAEVKSTHESSLEDHAWFIGFAPVENPTLAIAVVVENGGSGGAHAAPLAGEILKKAEELGY